MNRAARWPAPPLGVAAVGLALGAVGESLARSVSRDASAQYTLVLCLLAVATTPLAPPRRAAAVIVTAASVLSAAPFHSLTVAGAAGQLVVLYRLSRGGSTLPAGVLASPFLVLALADPGRPESRVLVVTLAALAPAAVWAGTERRSRQEAREQSAARHVIDGALLEHTARGERARIARELHDIVAHHISMIAVQAENARLTTAGMPRAGAQRLSAIADTARMALTEMRRLLGVLREDAAADLAPQPGLGLGLGELNDLLDEARDAAQTGIRLILHGPPDVLDPGVELAAYRIVQEALTNARRHAPGAAVDVELHYAADSVRLRIRDDGPGPPPVPARDGHGLLGMRERAAAVGGRLRTGSAPGGGFIVESVLPVKTETIA